MLLIDEFTKKFSDLPSIIEWLDSHEIEVKRYLESRFHEVDDQVWNYKKFIRDPVLGKLLVSDSMQTNSRKQDKFLQWAFNNTWVASMIGRKGGGKTGFCAWLSERMHELGMPVFWIETNYNLPCYLHTVSSFDDVDDGSLVIYDEAGLALNARRAMSKENVDVSMLLMISRHRKLRIIFNQQAIGTVDPNAYRLSDAFFIKPMQMTDTAEIQDKRTQLLMKYLVQMQPRDFRHVLFTNGNDWLTFSHELPDWWTEDISKSYAKADTETAISLITAAYSQGASIRSIKNKLQARGISLEDSEVKLAIESPRQFRKMVDA